MAQPDLNPGHSHPKPALESPHYSSGEHRAHSATFPALSWPVNTPAAASPDVGPQDASVCIPEEGEDHPPSTLVLIVQDELWS